jgi:hypothetical protein
MMRTLVYIPHVNGPGGCKDTARLMSFIGAHQGEFNVIRLEPTSIMAQLFCEKVGASGDRLPLAAVIKDDDDETVVKSWGEPSDADLDEVLDIVRVTDHAVVMIGVPVGPMPQAFTDESGRRLPRIK